MSDEKKPDPIEDVRKGLGLLFRAAKNAVSELPTGKVEEVVATGLREVGRAVESVASTIEREVFKSGAKEPAKADEEAKSADEAVARGADAGEHGASSSPSPSPSPAPAPAPAPAPTPTPSSDDDHVRIDK